MTIFILCDQNRPKPLRKKSYSVVFLAANYLLSLSHSAGIEPDRTNTSRSFAIISL